jgi:queuine/archaeosine tRNA-ribosyltransferase
MGYDYIALGGMVPLKTPEIEACLRAIEDVRLSKTRLHLLGITRTELVKNYERYGVTSFDSTSPFRQAFKDDRDNYYTRKRKYLAIRVMQIDANHRLKQRVLAGELDQNQGRTLEQKCLRTLLAYDRDECSIERTLNALHAYDSFLGEPDRMEEYSRTLRDRPWRKCRCGICAVVGIHVVIFRGTERNKRRGFHNLFVFNKLLQKELALA